jgi:uncharacterized protein YbaR (Trm112 family)
VSDDKRVADQTRESRRAIAKDDSAALEPWLIGLLVCPVDRGAVRLNGSELICERCGRRYQVRNGIPNMLPNHAKIEQQF